MLVSDVFEDAKDVLGFCSDSKIFSRLTDAIEVLANKGQWEPLLAYLLIPTTSGNIVTLPDTVEVPLRVNLDNNPAFARDKIYEFTMNGPGSEDERVDWTWEDRGDISTITATGDGVITDAPDVTIPSKRKIRISKPGVAIRALVRRKTAKITSKSDFIPLHSKMAIILMLKALESYRRGTPNDFQLGQGQEEQALKFLTEEQKSRGAFQDLAKAIDQPSIIGYAYHSNNVVVVADIYDEASAICGGVGKPHVFDRISEAVEVLANKGQWDSMTAYLDMTPSSDLIGLPRQVEIPIRINIEDKPAFARSRLFEFSANGPGTDLSEVTILTWEDQGDLPIMNPLVRPSTIAVQGFAVDHGKKITVTGIDNNNKEQTHTYTVPGQENTEDSGSITWKTITRVSKEVTQRPVTIVANAALISFMYPDETEGKFRAIKLSKQATAIKIMFRRSSLKVSSVDDIIPLKSRSAITTMMRSLQLMKDPATIQAAQALEGQALKYLQEEEQSRLAFIQASSKDQMPALGINTNNRGVITAADVYDDAADIFGPIGRQNLFDKITEGMEVLANKSMWDGLDGYVDIIADQRGYITLPRRVETPVAVNFYNCPTIIRSKWYEFHLNGFGSNHTGGNYLDDLGEFPLMVEPTDAVRLYARTFFESDRNRVIRAYGYDNTGNWIRTLENGKFVDGERVPVSVVANAQEEPVSIPTTNKQFRRVTRVSKEMSDMPMDLFCYQSKYSAEDYTNPARPAPPPPAPEPPPAPLMLATYEADEVEPMFRRFRIPKYVTWVRMRYRLSVLCITKMSDVLNMRSKTAIVAMMRALKALEKGDVNAYAAQEAVAVKLISEEQTSRSPTETFDLQFDQRTCFADPLQGQY